MWHLQNPSAYLDISPSKSSFAGFRWCPDRVEKVRFKDGSEIYADLVVMAVGIMPNIKLFLYHEKLDWMYTLYMIGLGAAIEYTGVWSGEWYYPGDPLGGVPPWFISLWGGVGFFLRRLAFPLIYPSSSEVDKKT